MVDAHVAVSLQKPIFIDINGKPENHETKRFGLKQNIKFAKHKWILFANKSVFITPQKKDGHPGGQKFVVERGTAPQIMPSTTDHKFSFLPLTSASRDSLLCNNISGKRGCSCHLEVWC